MDEADKATPQAVPNWAGWAVVAGLFVVVIGGCALLRTGNSGPSLDEQHRDATRVCEGFVKDRIAAPGLAEFSDEHAVGSTDTSVTVTGTVDSPTRSVYSCTVALVGDNWRLDNLTLT